MGAWFTHPLKSARPRPPPRGSGALEADTGSDLENAVEAEGRAIRGVAMSVAATRAPEAMAAIGSGVAHDP